MGCDIHLHVEIKIKGKWYNYDKPNIDRNYSLFAKMANVRSRNEISPISKPKGLPDDISFITKFHSDYDGVDGHSHSYLTIEEIAELAKWIKEKGWKDEFGSTSFWFEKTFGYFFGGSYPGLWEYPEDWERLKEQGLEDVRFVFWFDN